MHYELNVLFYFRFSIYDEHHLINPVGDEALETQVAQCYNIGDSIFTESHTFVVAINRWLAGHCHCAAIYCKSHFSVYLSGIPH